jgi:hypothetical protein
MSGASSSASGGGPVVIDVEHVAPRLLVLAPPPADVIGDRCSLVGNLFLDRVASGAFQITNTLTKESRRLPTGTWELVFSQNGKGASLLCLGFEEGAQPKTVPITKYLNRECFELPDGKHRIRNVDDQVWFDLEQQMCKHSEIALRVQTGPTAAEAALQVFLMYVKRPMGTRIFFAVPSLHAFMNIKTYRGIVSDWFWKGEARWCAHWQKRFGALQLLYGHHGNMGADKIALLPTHDRCL